MGLGQMVTIYTPHYTPRFDDAASRKRTRCWISRVLGVILKAVLE